MTLKIQGLLATCTQLWSNISQSIMCIHEWCDQLILLHNELLTKEQVKLGLCTSVQKKLHGIPEVFLNRCLPVTWDSSVQLILIGFGSFPYWKSPDMSATFREKSLTKDHHHRTTFSSHIYLSVTQSNSRLPVKLLDRYIRKQYSSLKYTFHNGIINFLSVF